MANREVGPLFMLASEADFVLDIGSKRGSGTLGIFAAHFPGMSVEASGQSTPLFKAWGARLGNGRVYSVTACCFSERRVARQPDALSGLMSLVIPVTGVVEIREPGRRCVVGPGSGCINDGQRAFSLALETAASMVTMLVPREAVLRRFPYFDRNSTRPLDPEDPGTIMLREMVLRMIPLVTRLDDIQRSTLLWAIIDSFGLPRISIEETEWRVQKAYSYILGNLSEPSLNADAVARSQFISRRSLDKIFVRVKGRPVTAMIADCRLNQAAEAVTDPAQANRSIRDIANGVGFEHPAHFTRAFVRHFGATPSTWRRRRRSPAG